MWQNLVRLASNPQLAMRFARVAGPKVLQAGAQITGQTLANPYARTALGTGIGYATAPADRRLQGGLAGGGLAYIGGGPTGPLMGSVTNLGARGLAGVGVPMNVAQNVAQIGVPIAALKIGSDRGQGNVVSNVIGGQQPMAGIPGAGRDLAGSQILYNAQGEPVSAYGPSVPQGYGQFGPPGNIPYMSQPWDNINPLGPLSMNLLMSNRQAQTARDNINVLAPTQMKYAEERARRELDRQLVAQQVRKNTDLAAEMTANQQVNALNMGRDTLQGVTEAINANPRYW